MSNPVIAVKYTLQDIKELLARIYGVEPSSVLNIDDEIYCETCMGNYTKIDNDDFLFEVMI
jgi:hypothetical protein